MNYFIASEYMQFVLLDVKIVRIRVETTILVRNYTSHIEPKERGNTSFRVLSVL
jgi:hypothetical protein